tara:strand:+ start:14569 stop:15690 length:1122 start_codon:yes stop_codon:yes gene_type:complete
MLPICEGDPGYEPWNVGLIVGPSGAGKTTIARDLFGQAKLDAVDDMAWAKTGVIDDFDERLTVDEISKACGAVGFNTIPAWVRPFHVLSNGEKFRVSMARLMAESGLDAPAMDAKNLEDVMLCDEFTSVVDRQVAQIGSHAVQKMVRRGERRFVAVTCHHDVEDWLQPDWIFEPSSGAFRRRPLRRRPELDITIGALDYSYWSQFAPFHYMSSTLHRAARSFGLMVNGELAAYAAVHHYPVSSRGLGGKCTTFGFSRGVTFPDYQGLGLVMILIERISQAYAALGMQINCYPAHPSLIRACQKAPEWNQTTKAGSNLGKNSKTMPVGGRQNATFRYTGAPMVDVEAAVQLVCAKELSKGKKAPYPFTAEELAQ